MKTQFLKLPGGRIAYDATGQGPLVLLSPGLGDLRQVYRFMGPRLVQAGYQVVTADMRGHGESSMGWPSITRTDVAGDLLALIRYLGEPAVIVGHSLSGGAATIAAAMEPELVNGIIEINPYTKTQKIDLGALLGNRRYRRAFIRLAEAGTFDSPRLWIRYLDLAYPTKPADYADYMDVLEAKLREPGRMAEFKKTGKSTPADAEARLPGIKCPALIIMGAEDPDFASPRAEGEAIVTAMPAGLGTVAMIEGGGHYPHAQCPDQVAACAVRFLRQHALAPGSPARPAA